jgi:hypothetical protein
MTEHPIFSSLSSLSPYVPLPLTLFHLSPHLSFPSSLFLHFFPSLQYLILVPDFSLSIFMASPPSTLILSLLTHISSFIALHS